MRTRGPVAIGLAFAALVACGDAAEPPAPTSATESGPIASAFEAAAPPPATIRGTLTLSAAGGPGAPGATPGLHRSVFVNGWGYAGQEDNDLRGFLDGRFAFPWNQPTQSHVRAGRRQHSPEFGETELFRVLYEWDALGLPSDAAIEAASLTLSIEKTSLHGAAVTALLYELHGDVDAGQGGVAGNNVDRPRPGEVWWGQRGYGREPWGHPGASHASDVDPAADTGAHALAEARIAPGDAQVVFAAAGLAAAAQSAARDGRPLRLLLKLADRDEDTRGSLVHFWSGNLGLDRHPVRRPRLELDWWSPGIRVVATHRIQLEHGRRAEVPPLRAPGAERFDWSFVPDEGSEWPTLEIGDGSGAWNPAPAAGRRGGGALALRLSATRDAVVHGTPFVASFRDTWVTTGPREAQEVPFEFVGPDGTLHRVSARFIGDHRWEVRFVPEQLGRWRYRFSHQLDQPYRSAEGVFDCVAGGPADIARQLDELEARIRARAFEDPRDAVPAFGAELMKLERAVLRALTPAERRGPVGLGLDARIVAIRNRMDTKAAAPRLGLGGGDAD